jgi:ADP-ribose pyrophosphatase
MANSRSRRRTKLERIVSSKISYKGPVFQVTTDDVVEPGGVRARRDVIHHSGSVVVLPVDDTGREPKVLLERQYRHAAQSYLWELPAGRIDEGETELAAAKRELIEETGYRAKHWKRILNFYASPGFLGETMSIYLATGLRQGEAEPEEDERIVTRVFPLCALVDNVLRGKIRDGKTIAGVLWLETQRRKRTRE